MSTGKTLLKKIKTKRKEDALAMARIAYDVFKEKKQREMNKSIIVSGQNNAKQPSNT